MWRDHDILEYLVEPSPLLLVHLDVPGDVRGIDQMTECLRFDRRLNLLLGSYPILVVAKLLVVRAGWLDSLLPLCELPFFYRSRRGLRDLPRYGSYVGVVETNSILVVQRGTDSRDQYIVAHFPAGVVVERDDDRDLSLRPNG